MYEKILLFASPVFLLLIGIECVVARLRHRSEYRLGDALAAIGLGALSTYVGVFTRVFSFGIYVALFEHHRLFSLDRGSAWVWVSGLVLYDFLYYWNHRLGHEVAILWAAHVVHHQGEEFNLSTALRQTGTGFLLSWVFYVPMAMLGYPPEVFLVLSLIDLLYQFWIHTEQIGSLGVFDRIFASPSNHRVHHAVNDLYVDRNYGGILILWDRLFGSFQPELPTLPPVYGTRDPLRSWNPLWANVHSYWTLLRDSWHARRWSDRVRIFLKPPGWRPVDVAARFPKAPFDIGKFRKYAPVLPQSLAAYCFVQGLLVLAFGSYFLNFASSAAMVWSLAYLLALLLSLWIISGLAEARPGFVLLEALRLCILVGIVHALAGRGVLPTRAAEIAVVGAMVGFMGWLISAGRSLYATGNAPQEG
jgi:alkylglycerol monooxygenase